MRTTLIVLAWLSFVGSLFDGAIALFHVGLAVTAHADWGISVYTHMQDNLPWLLWVKDIAYLVLPDEFVDWVFDLPNLVYFPVRIITSILFGWRALTVARRL